MDVLTCARRCIKESLCRSRVVAVSASLWGRVREWALGSLPEADPDVGTDHRESQQAPSVPSQALRDLYMLT